MSLRVARRKPINAECTSYIEKGYSVIHKGLYVKGRVFDKNKLPFLLHIFSSEFHRAKLRVSSSEIFLVEGYLGSLN